MFKTVEFGDFAAWWVFITRLQLSWSFPFGKPLKILIFPALLSTVQCQELRVPSSRERNAAGRRNPADGIRRSDAEKVAKYHP